MKPNYMSDPKPSRLTPGKKAVFIITQGNPDPNAFDIFPDYDRFFKWFGYEGHVIRGLGLGAKTDAAGKEDLLKQAEELAKEVLH